MLSLSLVSSWCCSGVLPVWLELPPPSRGSTTTLSCLAVGLETCCQVTRDWTRWTWAKINPSPFTCLYQILCHRDKKRNWYWGHWKVISREDIFKYYFSYCKENIPDNLECRQGMVQENKFSLLNQSHKAWQWLCKCWKNLYLLCPWCP